MYFKMNEWVWNFQILDYSSENEMPNEKLTCLEN